MELIIVDDSQYGWDIYVDKNDKLWSVSKDGNTNGNSFFGTVSHIHKLIRGDQRRGKNYFNDKTLTEKGLTLFSGLHHRLTQYSDGAFWTLYT